MKNLLIVLLLVLAVVLLVCGIQTMNSCNAIDLQHQGFTYYEALEMASSCHSEGSKMIFFSILSVCAAFGLYRVKSI